MLENFLKLHDFFYENAEHFFYNNVEHFFKVQEHALMWIYLSYTIYVKHMIFFCN